MKSYGASYSPFKIYRILMARALTYKKTAGHKSSERSHPVKKANPKKASKLAHGNSTSKGKVSPKKVKHREVMEKRKETSSPARHPAKKGKIALETESKKSALKTHVAPPVEAPPHLLRQTKTTAAALAFLGKGVELIFQKDFKKARAELKTLLETYPGEIDILARARSYIQICDREETTQKKLAVTEDQLYSLGVLEHNKANYEKAISYFLQSLRNHPDADYIYYSVAASLAMKGDLAKSLEHLRKAVELNEDSRIYAKNDSDFLALQTNKEFMELIGLNLIPAN
jgi:tetratricopeptide (TPR) repeat protein